MYVDAACRFLLAAFCFQSPPLARSCRGEKRSRVRKSPHASTQPLHCQHPCGASLWPHMVTWYFAVPSNTARDLGAAVGPRDAVCKPTTHGYALALVNHCPSYGQIHCHVGSPIEVRLREHTPTEKQCAGGARRQA